MLYHMPSNSSVGDVNPPSNWSGSGTCNKKFMDLPGRFINGKADAVLDPEGMYVAGFSSPGPRRYGNT
ncbi:hypothetical protein EZV62_013728 [Acer yangbiense]|uniref:Uncharacterized protein n=1 Tax=Acer yangbiense TaxID=1000413 RepID=A0A5C7HZR6_9ROSI|nr:hypothetical protein EZV62_013728 [Acer yangbiense]